MKKPCRICGGTKFEKVLDMGMNPLVNSLIEVNELKEKEETYSLKVVRCTSCSLVQLEKPIDSNKIYKDVDYLYFSSDMPGLADYFREYAEELKPYLESEDLVVEIGSNDGIMLRPFAEWGFPVLGVDPATNVAIRAFRNGIPTLPLFFTERLAKQIRAEFGQAKVIYGNNCIAHIDDLQDVMNGVKELLTDNGIFVVECNYWGGMVKNTNYALVYHDHFSYFSLKNWVDFAPRFGLEVFDATVTPAQGGSLRVFMAKSALKKTERMVALLKEEQENKLNTSIVAKKYGRECLEAAMKLSNLVKTLKAQGFSIAGYGAAAKGFSVLKLANITQEHIDYFVDDSPAKQGKYTPVTHIPVISREKAEEKLPDYFFITAPNYATQIMDKEQDFLKNGGKFILCDSTIVG